MKYQKRKRAKGSRLTRSVAVWLLYFCLETRQWLWLAKGAGWDSRQPLYIFPKEACCPGDKGTVLSLTYTRTLLGIKDIITTRQDVQRISSLAPHMPRKVREQAYLFQIGEWRGWWWAEGQQSLHLASEWTKWRRVFLELRQVWLNLLCTKH